MNTQTDWEPIIRDLAASLNTTAENLTAVMVEGIKIDSAVSIVFWGIAAIVSILIILIGIKLCLKYKDDDPADIIPMGVVIIALGLITLFPVSLSLKCNVSDFLAPEYAAFQQILRELH